MKPHTKAHLLLTMVLLLTAMKVMSQETKKLTLYFDNNSAALTQKAQHQLDSFLNTERLELEKSQIRLVGHTDVNGSLALNEKLSESRSKTVKKFLQKTGIPFRSIDTEGQAYFSPQDNDTSLLDQNRRVEVMWSLPDKNLYRLMGIKDSLKTEYTVNNTEGAQVQYGLDTRITIPANAFLTADGDTVTGDVDVEYREFRDPMDFVMSGIPMTVAQHGQHLPFNSGGMFKISASQNGEPVYLNPNNPIVVDMVPESLPVGMNYYYFDTLGGDWQKRRELNPGGRPTASAPLVLGDVGDFPRDGNTGDRCMITGPREEVDVSPCQKGCNAQLFTLGFGHGLVVTELPIDLKNPLAPHFDQQSMLSDSLRTMTYTYPKLAQNNKSSYISLTKKKGKAYYFKIKSSDRRLPVSAYKRMVWKYKAPEKVKKGTHTESVFPAYGQKWENVKPVWLGDDAYELRFFADGDSLVMPVQAAFAKRYRKNPEQLINSLSNRYTRGVNNRIAAQKPYLMKRLDSLNCFYEGSKPYMAAGEDTLNFEAWIAYFNANRDMMKERYTDLFENRMDTDLALGVCIREQQEIIAQQAIQKARMDSLRAVQEKRAQLYKKRYDRVLNAASNSLRLQVDKLGIWNCDQVSRLKNPIRLTANFRDQDGKRIDVQWVYTIDKNINGVIMWNSYGKEFVNMAYSPESETRLFILSYDMELFEVSTLDFRPVATGRKTTHQFILGNPTMGGNEELGMK